MKQQHLIKMLTWLRLCIVGLIMVILSLFLFSFKMDKMAGDFLKQLGISQSEADNKITNSLLGGSLDYSGIRNLHSILAKDRAAVVKDIAAHAKQYANSAAFKKAYTTIRDNNKPAPMKEPDTPEEFRAGMIKNGKEYVKNSEDALKNAGANMKQLFEKMLEGAKQNLKEAEDPNNKNLKAYTKNYDAIKKMTQESYDNSIKEWESKYPANHLQFIKVKLQAYLDATNDIDFDAQLVEKKGKKYFVNPDYERKGDRWKMAFRAGKDAVEAGRAFAKQWVGEIQ